MLPLLPLLTVLAASPAPFVGVVDSHFAVGDAPFVFAGANIDAIHGQPERAHLEPILDAVKRDGLTVVRVWALGEGRADAPDYARTHVLFRAGPDGFIEPAYVALDRVLVAAKARGLRVMLTLCNAWPDYGGVRQYLEWAQLPTDGFGAVDRFYSDTHVRAALLAHLDRLLARTNSISGVRYVDDPTIFAWELMNESQVDTAAGARARRAFVDELARHIHALDAHHLVTSGVEGYGTRAERAEWRAVCALPSVDFCDSHFYPQTTDRVADVRALEQRIDDRVQLAHFVVGKPIVFGEFGFDTRPDHDQWLGRGRASWFGRTLGQLARERVDGAVVWIYQAWSGAPRDFGIYVDRPDTDDVRATLRRFAARLSDRGPLNPRLGAEHGDALLYPAYQTLRDRSTHTVTRDDRGTTIALSADRFDLAHWERGGRWVQSGTPHAYGAGDGWFEWRFAVAAPVHGLVVRARLSSELPGSSAPPDAWSIVDVELDGQVVGAVTAIADDGQGAVVELHVDDPNALARLTVGAHRLRLVVPPGPHAHGLCVYRGEPGLVLRLE